MYRKYQNKRDPVSASSYLVDWGWQLESVSHACYDWLERLPGRLCKKEAYVEYFQHKNDHNLRKENDY